jgi:hypothetical protein
MMSWLVKTHQARVQETQGLVPPLGRILRPKAVPAGANYCPGALCAPVCAPLETLVGRNLTPDS